VVSIAGAVLFPTQLPHGPQLTDNRTTTATIGTPVAIGFGTFSVAGTVIWLAPYTQTTEGAKGGPQQTTYQYNQSIALGLCEAVIDGAPSAIGGITRIWENGTIVYDIRPQLQADTAIGQVAETDQEYANRLAASAAYAETFVLYLGSEDQMPDPTIEAIEGVGATPAFRGLAYIVYPNRLLQTAQAWRHPNFKFECYQVGTGACSDSTGFSADYVAPWEEGVGYPPSTLGTYAFNINSIDGHSEWSVGTQPSSATIYSSVDDALAAANSFRPGAYNEYLGYGIFGDYPGTIDKSGGPLVISGPKAGGMGVGHPDPPSVLLVYQFKQPDNSSWFYNSSTAQPSPSPTNGSLYGVANAHWWQIDTMIHTTPYPAPGGGAPAGIPFDPFTSFTYYGGYYYWEQLADLVINCTRVPGVPPSPCNGLIPAPQFPGWATNSSGQLVKCNPWVKDTSQDYLWLQGYSGNTIGGDFLDYPILYPTNPCVTLSSPEASDETFWTDAYNAAVAAGKLAAGKTYVAGGSTDPTSSFYPFRSAYGWSLDEVTCEGSGAEVTVADIITAICARAGLTRIDVSDMEGISVNGYVVSQVTDGASVITPLRSVGFFDAVDSGPVLRFQSRGKPIVATLTTDDIGAYDSSSDQAQATVPPSVAVVRADESTLPRTIRFHYIAVSRDYQDGEQDSPFRLTTTAVNDVDVQIAVALGDVQAAQCAEILWADAWAGQTTYEVSVDQSWSALEPGDAIGVPVDGVIQRMRIVSDSNASGVLRKLSCVRDDSGAYISFAVANPPQYQPQKLTLLTPTDDELMDLPALQDSDNDPGFYVGMQPDTVGGGTSWKGAVLYKSIDGGETFSPAVTMTQATLVGAIEDAVPASEFWTWDTATEIIVNVPSSATTFESRTDDAVLAGANAAAMGADQRWEVIQFATATQLSDTQWMLSRLLRGRRGTEWVLGSSQPGDQFVMLVAAQLGREVLNTTEIGAQRIYQPISIGLSSGAESAFTGFGMALRPFSPVDVSAYRDGSTGDIVIEWTRRDRLGRTLMSGVDMPLSEATLAFQVDILNHAASPFTVHRTLAVTTEEAIYTLAQQEADFGSPLPTTISVRVYQMSAVVGRGTPGLGDNLEVGSWS
jgi:hypothetical protein